jgi:hypothetical protein
LVDGIQQKNLQIVEAAILELREMTGRDFGFDPKAPKKQRQVAINQWKAWYKQNA